jgi:two-component sensor histidine kinase
MKHHDWYASSLLIGFIAFLSIGIVVAGSLHYRAYKRQHWIDVETQLHAITDLKKQDLVQWREERLSDGEYFGDNPYLSVLIKQVFDAPHSVPLRNQLQNWLNIIENHSPQYDRISVLDGSGEEILSAPNIPAIPSLVIRQQILSTAKSRKTQFVDFYRNEQDQKIYLAILVPIRGLDTNKVHAFLMLRIDPQIYLYPYISRWPTNHATSDITDRKISEAFSSGVLDSLTAHIAVINKDGIVVAINDAWRRFALENDAHSKNGYIGMNYFAICEAAIRNGEEKAAEAAINKIKDAIKGKKDTLSIEYDYHSPNEERWFAMHATQFSTDEESYVVISHENITKQKKSQEYLRLQEEFCRVLLENITDGVIACDANMNLVLFNRRAREWHGADASKLSSEQWGSFYNLFDADEDSSVCICVADNGVGLPEDFEQRRSHSLGLQLVSDLAGQLGGKLEIASNPGASFTLIFKPKTGSQ